MTCQVQAGDRVVLNTRDYVPAGMYENGLQFFRDLHGRHGEVIRCELPYKNAVLVAVDRSGPNSPPTRTEVILPMACVQLTREESDAST